MTDEPPRPKPLGDGVWYQCFRCGCPFFVPRTGPYIPPPPKYCDPDIGGCGRTDEEKKSGTAFKLIATGPELPVWPLPKPEPAAEAEPPRDPDKPPEPIEEPEKKLKDKFGEHLAEGLIIEHRMECKACRGKAKVSSRAVAIEHLANIVFRPKESAEERLTLLWLARSRGRYLAERGEHMPALRAAMDVLHVKDDGLKMLILISCLVTAIERPRRIRMPILAIGKSQFGKSHVEKIFGQLIPGGYEDRPEERDKGYWVARQSISPKALYYMGKENPKLLANKILFIDELGDMDEDTLGLLKALTSYDLERMVHGTVINHKYCELTLEGLPTLLTNTAEFTLEPAQMEQAFNRWLMANVDESDETSGAIADYQADADELGSIVERNFEVIECAREIIRYLMQKKDFDVRVPFSKLIKLEIPNIRINRQKFIDLIRGFTYLYWPVRPHKGDIYFSTLEDYEMAIKLWSQIEGFTFGQIDETAFKIIRLMSNLDYMTTSDIYERCKTFTSAKTVERRLKRMEDVGLVLRRQKVKQTIIIDEDSARRDRVWYEDMWRAAVDPLHIYQDLDGTLIADEQYIPGLAKALVATCQLEDFDGVSSGLVTEIDETLKKLSPIQLHIINTIYNIIYNNSSSLVKKEESVRESLALTRAVTRSEGLSLLHFPEKVVETPPDISGVARGQDVSPMGVTRPPPENPAGRGIDTKSEVLTSTPPEITESAIRITENPLLQPETLCSEGKICSDAERQFSSHEDTDVTAKTGTPETTQVAKDVLMRQIVAGSRVSPLTAPFLLKEHGVTLGLSEARTLLREMIAEKLIEEGEDGFLRTVEQEHQP